ncbi:hypothetical protein vseg_012423 [Gypsophila vaccaria]
MKIPKSINPKSLLKSISLSKSKSKSQSQSSSFSSSTTTATTTSTTSSSSSSSSSSAAFKFDVVSAFKLLDRDGDGKIDRHELKHLFTKSLSDIELEEMIRELDVDGDGCISLDELQAVGSVFDSTAREEEEAELRAAFEFFDTDHDGLISAVELYDGFIKLGDDRCTLEECRRMIQGVDVNKDGFVCFHDFSRMMDVIPT